LITPRSFIETFRLGVKSVLLHKLRSALTVLGILIGVTAVIWLVAMGEGISYQAQQQIKSLGATSIIIRSSKPTIPLPPGDAGSFIFAYGLLRDDYRRILETVPAITQAVPMKEFRQNVNYGDRVIDARLVGCTPDYAEMNQLVVDRGRFIEDRDSVQADNVAVLGEEAARTLFPFEEPVGKSVQVGREFYVVVGTMQFRNPSAGIGGSLSAQDFNLDVYIPLRTFQWRIGDTVVSARTGSRSSEKVELHQITVKVDSIEDVDSTASLIGQMLKPYHRFPDYTIVVPKELLRQAETLRMMFTMLLVVIAGISLLVGGIGIMNIMLATVTERTREIGIRRALGAKRSHIQWQFLSETLVLTLTGGLLGIALGLLCGPVVQSLQWAGKVLFPEVYRTLPESVQNLEPRVALWSIFVSLGIAVFVGLFFGLYPARRAAHMDPIDALRHE
jgi:putative ABC transport system permease protein